MKTIAYIIPYFGRLPKGFEFWLLSCEKNPTIDWLLFTDDLSDYAYPRNVSVTHCSFSDIRTKIQGCFDFEIELNKPYKLCDFKAAYGDIFKNELEGYDYWGICDIDLVWGDIRSFLTDDLLTSFERIGNQGHSTLFLNKPEVNIRYRECIEGLINYKTVFTSSKSFCFDESGLDNIYKALCIPYFKETNFAHLLKYNPGFFLGLLPGDDDYKNNRQIISWNNGEVIRYYLDGNEVKKDYFMYCHFWCRPITFKVDEYSIFNSYLVYADVVEDSESVISYDLINKLGKPHPIIFTIKMIWKNKHKITFKRIMFNIKGILGMY